MSAQNKKKSRMSALNRHLDSIVAAILLDKQTSIYLKQDFALIRDYLGDILRRNVAITQMLSESKYLGSDFNCSVVLDMTRFIGLKSRFNGKLPSCLKMMKTMVKNAAWLGSTPFAVYHTNVPGELLTQFVRDTIAQGLRECGCFVRGHKGDIYELELVETCVQPQEEWQCQYVTVNASTDTRVLSIRLRVLIKWLQTREDPEPYPMYTLKAPWMAAANVRKHDYTICAPQSEKELSKHTAFCMAYRLLLLLFRKQNLYNLRIVHLLSACYEKLYINITTGKIDTCTTLNVMVQVVSRMVGYLGRGHFPFYWNTRIDLIKLFPSKASERYLHKACVEILGDIKAMESSKTLNCDDVENFFGIQINPNILHVDEFGIYKTFWQPPQ